MSNTIFSQNLRKLRESKKIPQKSAAASLGISQALLSHYEKGIRECKLEFLVRAAKFYGVTTDFLLGASETGNIDSIGNIGSITISNADIIGGGLKLSEQFVEDILAPCMNSNKIKDNELKKDGVEINTYSILYKNLVINALSYIFDEMKDMRYKDASVLSGKYISLIIYRLYTLLYNNSADAPLSSLSSLSSFAEKFFLTELKYIIGLKNLRDDKDNPNSIQKKYNFENLYLNNIINSNL